MPRKSVTSTDRTQERALITEPVTYFVPSVDGTDCARASLTWIRSLLMSDLEQSVGGDVDAGHCRDVAIVCVILAVLTSFVTCFGSADPTTVSFSFSLVIGMCS